MKVSNWKFSQSNANCRSQSEPVVGPATGTVSLSPPWHFVFEKYHEIFKSHQNWNFPIDWKNILLDLNGKPDPIYNKWVSKLKRDFHPLTGPENHRNVNISDPQSSPVSSVGRSQSRVLYLVLSCGWSLLNWGLLVRTSGVVTHGESCNVTGRSPETELWYLPPSSTCQPSSPDQ